MNGAAIADLSRALELGDHPALRYNRALAYRALGRTADTLADLDAADPDDPTSRKNCSTARRRRAAGEPMRARGYAHQHGQGATDG